MVTAKVLNMAKATPVEAIQGVGRREPGAARSLSPERGAARTETNRDARGGVDGGRGQALVSSSPERLSAREEARRDSRGGREGGKSRGGESRSPSSERLSVKRGAERGTEERAGKSRRCEPRDPSAEHVSAKQPKDTELVASRDDREVAKDDGKREASSGDEMEVGGIVSRGPADLHPRARMILQRRRSTHPSKLRLDLLEALSVQIVLEREREPVGYSLAPPVCLDFVVACHIC